MKDVVARIALASLLASSSSCNGTHEAPPPPEQAALGGDAAARVGSDVIPVSLVAKVAAAQHITPREALKRLVDDAVAAEAARSKGRDGELPTSWQLTAARARMTADRLLADAKLGGPPTDEEVKTLSARYWREVDRPPAVRVVHALVPRPKKPDPAAEASARALAGQLHEALVDAKDVDDFEAKAKAVPAPGVEVVVEKLPAFTDEGVSIEGDQRLEPAFAHVAFAIGEPGMTSAVVESRYGWHVIRLVERIPEQRMPFEGRRIAFADETVAMRAAAATKERVEALRPARPIAIEPSAENLMRLLMTPAGRGLTP
jgi:hypothetical protein